MLIFFRNDDLGWQPAKFQRLVELFEKHQMPLNAAAIPTSCQESYSLGNFSDLKKWLQIHVHGYSHLDHETLGKKCEFGQQRHPDSVARDLLMGFETISTLFSENFFAAFTPPWNRIDSKFFPILKEIGFQVLSRDESFSSESSGLIDLNVHLDLHTSRVPRPKGAEKIVEWIEQRINHQKDPLGIMLHHCRMQEDDFDELDQLLDAMRSKGYESCFMSEVDL